MTAFERSPCGTACACGSIFARSPASAIISTIRARATKRSWPSTAAMSRAWSWSLSRPSKKSTLSVERHAALRVEDIDRPRALGLVPLADFEIVEVVRGRDLDRACALFRIGIFVGDDRDQPADQRQANMPAEQMLVARVVGVDRDRGVAEHRLGPRGGDGHAFAGLLALRVHDRIVEVIEMPVRIFGRGPWRAPPRRAARRPRATT